MNLKKTSKKRFIAVLLSTLFILNHGAYSSPLGNRPIPPPHTFVFSESFSVPQEFGTLERLKSPEVDRPFVVILQDAHGIVDAQLKIWKLIEYLSRHQHISWVGMEGGAGPADVRLLKTFPDELIKRKVMRGYLSRGEITGAGFAAVFGKSRIRYQGIEDEALYEDHLAAYNIAVSKQKQSLLELQRFRSDLGVRRASLFSESALAFSESVEAFYQEKITLNDMIQKLVPAVAAEKNSAVDGSDLKQFPHLGRLFEGYRIQQKIKSVDAKGELKKSTAAFRKLHLKNLDSFQQKAFEAAFQEYQTGQRDATAYLSALQKAFRQAGGRISLTEPLKLLADQNHTFAAIKGSALYDELGTYLDWRMNSKLRSPEEHHLARDYRGLRLAEGLIKLELRRKQWDEINPGRSAERWRQMSHLFAGFDPEPFLDFYRLAEARDQMLYDQLIKKMAKDKTKAAVVVAGGFHTQGLLERFQKEGI